jgi:soluble lytic murein transglycosylase-like protein
VPRTLLSIIGLGAAVLLSGCAHDYVPDSFRADVRAAGKECRGIGAKIIAAQIEQESGWDPAARSSQGAQGIAQFMPETWAAWGRDHDGDGSADPYSPGDAIRSQGRLMCHLLGLARRSKIDGDPVDLALAAYNAGWGPVERYRGIPPYPETVAYVAEIRERARGIRVAAS